MAQAAHLCGPTELAAAVLEGPRRVLHIPEVRAEEADQEAAELATQLRRRLLPEYATSARALRLRGLRPKLVGEVLEFLPATRPLRSVDGKVRFSPAVDLLFHAPAPSLQVANAALEAKLDAAWREDPDTCVRIVFRMGEWHRRSERLPFFDALLWLWRRQPLSVLANLACVPQLGSWRDLCELLARACEGDAVARARDRALVNVRALFQGKAWAGAKAFNNKTESKLTKLAKPWPTADDGTRAFPAGGRLHQGERALRRYHGDEHYRTLYAKVAELFAAQLRQDLATMNSGGEKVSMCAKWCPGLDTSFDRRTLICEGIARQLWPKEDGGEYAGMSERLYAFKVRDRLRREVLVPLKELVVHRVRRAKLEAKAASAAAFAAALESHALRSDLPDDDDDDPAPKKGPLAKPRVQEETLLEGHDPLRYWRFRRDLAKVKDLAAYWLPARKNDAKNWRGKDKKPERTELPERVQTALVAARWARQAAGRFREFTNAYSAPGYMAVVHDGSFSMEHCCAPKLRCLELSAALALVQSEVEGVFHQRAIIGGKTPRILGLHYEKQRMRVGYLLQARQHNPLDIAAVLQLVLGEQLRIREDHPTMRPVSRLLFTCDRDVTTATGSTHDQLRAMLLEVDRAYVAAGFALPEIVFWNLMGCGGDPVVAHMPGMVLLSGFSLALLDAVLAPRSPGQPLDLTATVSRALAPLAHIRAVIDPEAQGQASSHRTVATRHGPTRFAGLDVCFVLDTNSNIRRIETGTLAPLAEALGAEVARRTGLRQVGIRVGRVLCGERGRLEVIGLMPLEAYRAYRGTELGGRNKSQDIFGGISAALSLEWRGTLRLLVFTGDHPWKVFGNWKYSLRDGEAAAALTRRANALNVHLLSVSLTENTESLRYLLGRSYRIGDGEIPMVPMANRAYRRGREDDGSDSEAEAHPQPGVCREHRQDVIRQLVFSALARRAATALQLLGGQMHAQVASAPEDPNAPTGRVFHTVRISLGTKMESADKWTVIGGGGLAIQSLCLRLRANLLAALGRRAAAAAAAATPRRPRAARPGAAAPRQEDSWAHRQQRPRLRRPPPGLEVWVDINSEGIVYITIRGSFSPSELERVPALARERGLQLIDERLKSQRDAPGPYAIVCEKGLPVTKGHPRIQRELPAWMRSGSGQAEDDTLPPVLKVLEKGAVVHVVEVLNVDPRSYYSKEGGPSMWDSTGSVLGRLEDPEGGWIPLLGISRHEDGRVKKKNQRMARRVPGRGTLEEKEIALIRPRLPSDWGSASEGESNGEEGEDRAVERQVEDQVEERQVEDEAEGRRRLLESAFRGWAARRCPDERKVVPKAGAAKGEEQAASGAG